MNRKYVLVRLPGYWHVADFEIWDSGRLVERIWVNKFFDVTKDWFFIYDEIGGSGTGYRPGRLIRKIYIGDGNYEER